MTEEKKKAEEEAKAQAEAEEKKKAEEDKKPPFYVKKGKAITTKKGILSDGEEIKAEYLAGGKKSLAAFVKSGHVAKG